MLGPNLALDLETFRTNVEENVDLLIWTFVFGPGPAYDSFDLLGTHLSPTGPRGSCVAWSLALWDIRDLDCYLPKVFDIGTAGLQDPNRPWSLSVALQRRCRMRGFLEVGFIVIISYS